MDQRDIAIIGGDRRIACMAPIFVREGYRVIRYGTRELHGNSGNDFRSESGDAEGAKASSLKEALDNAGTIVCGIPFEKEGLLYCEENLEIPLPELRRCLRKRQRVFAGLIPDDFRRHCEERSIRCHDFLKDEPLTLFNAIATAEGAILEALSHKETLLHQSNCLVLGFGRCGSLIAERLRGLNASVTVTVSSPTELALADTKGFFTFPLERLAEEISKYDYVFNTIPACYLGEKCLVQMRQDCLIIDIASGRTGVDYEAAKELSLKALFCPGLPGKYAANSCAERLVKFVLTILNHQQT